MTEAIEVLECPVCIEFSSQSPKVVTFFVTWISSQWVDFMLDAISRIQRCGHIVRIIDVAQFSFPRVPINFRDLPSLKNGLFRDIEIISIVNSRKVKFDLEPSSWIQDAISSELATKYKGSLPKFFDPIKKLENYFAVELVRRLVSQLKQMKVDPPNEIWVYPNGRYSTQRAILETANELTLKSMCYERSRFYSRYYLRGYRVHDRVSLQADFVSRGRSTSVQSDEEVLQWLQDRRNPNSKTNQFSADFRSTASGLCLGHGQKLALFFSSSRDELEGLGPDWTTFEWSNQYEAFMSIGKYLDNLGWRLVLRLHPNLANKTLPDVRSEIKSIEPLRAIGFQVIEPNSENNSYGLVDIADLVVVSRSTIGIEAMSMGKKVLVTANSFYDQLPSCNIIRSESHLDVLGRLINSNSIRKEEAINWLAFNFERDFNFEIRNQPIRINFCKRLRGLTHADVMTYYIANYLFMLYTLVTRPIKAKLIRTVSKS